MRIKALKMPYFSVYSGSKFLPPLGLGVIYDALHKQGYDVSQDDLTINSYFFRNNMHIFEAIVAISRIIYDQSRLMAYLKGGNDDELEHWMRLFLAGVDLSREDVLLLSVYDCDVCSSTLAVLVGSYYKRMRKGVVVVGGEWAQVAYVHDNFAVYAATGAVDYYVSEHGEVALDKIMQYITGKRENLDDIPGLVYLKDGKVCEQFNTTPEGISSFSFYGLDLSRYTWSPSRFVARHCKGFSFPGKIMVMPFRNISGCPNKCAFCVLPHFDHLKISDTQVIVDGLTRLSQEYNTPYFFFADPTTNVSKDFIEKLCRAIIKAKLKIYWSACVSFRGMDSPDIFKLIKEAGACRLIFGLETASPRLLKLVDKNVAIEEAEARLRWAHEAGIWNELELIAGLPHENDEDLRSTLAFISRNKTTIDGVWLTKFFLVLQSFMGKYPERYGIKNVHRFYNIERSRMGWDEPRIYAFDEIDGLAWNDKRKQIDRSYTTILNFLRKNGIFDALAPESLNVLFYLYTHYEEKAQVKKYYSFYHKTYFIRNLPVLLLSKAFRDFGWMFA